MGTNLTMVKKYTTPWAWRGGGLSKTAAKVYQGSVLRHVFDDYTYVDRENGNVKVHTLPLL
jgi:hypothetical protein